jgi:predicted nucleic acid-binding protein
VAALPVALEAINSDTVFDRTQLISRKHGLTAYDAAYLNLALEGGLPLATLDDDLIRAANQEKVVLVSYL